MRRLCAVALPALATILSGCIGNPNAEANTAQAIMEMDRTINDMRQDIQALASSADSLRAVVAYHDTLISRLATLTSVPWPPPRGP